MKLNKRYTYECAAIVQPGEYTISIWDGKQCTETNPRLLAKCQECGKSFCLMKHYHQHMLEDSCG